MEIRIFLRYHIPKHDEEPQVTRLIAEHIAVCTTLIGDTNLIRRVHKTARLFVTQFKYGRTLTWSEQLKKSVAAFSCGKPQLFAMKFIQYRKLPWISGVFCHGVTLATLFSMATEACTF